VLLLRELEGDVDWHLPRPLRRGHGVSRATIGRLADEGCGLVITPSTGGITAAAEVAEAKARGLEVIVTDHHRPGAEAARFAPSSRRRAMPYPFPGALRPGVVYKLGQALFGVDSEIPKAALDLVALRDDRRRRAARRPRNRSPRD